MASDYHFQSKQIPQLEYWKETYKN
jgi:hypothetical protein